MSSLSSPSSPQPRAHGHPNTSSQEMLALNSPQQSKPKCTTSIIFSLSSASQITNESVRSQLSNDLNNADDSKRTLTSLDSTSASQLFGIFGLTNQCKADAAGNITGDNLKCLGKIYKNFVPQ